MRVRVNEMRVMVTVNFIGRTFKETVASCTMTSFSAMDITVAINSNCEIEINITIHTLALLSMCQNNYYSIVTLITPFGSSLPVMFIVSCILFGQLSIIAANSPDVRKQYPSVCEGEGEGEGETRVAVIMPSVPFIVIVIIQFYTHALQFVLAPSTLPET